MLDGLPLEAAEAGGKQMFLRFRGPVWLRVHLGLFGMWRFHGPGLAGFGRRTRLPPDEIEGPPAPRGAVRLRFAHGPHVADLSGPTACEILDEEGCAAAVAKMGADPLRNDADPEAALRKINASRSPLGLLLMRQDIIAGIGNIFRAEILFRARLDPYRPGRDLERAAWDALWADLRVLMADGVRTGRIVTTRTADRPRPRGVPPRKDAPREVPPRKDATYVAYRAGKPCRVCGAPVLAEAMAGRRLYWCGVCQKG